EAGRERIGRMIYRAIEQGSVRAPKGTSVSSLALAVQALITGSTIVAFTEGDRRAWPEHAKALELAIRALLRAGSSKA
ncbi:MAG TPA: hypothetical protein VM598_03255, partial [Bdellovibrionota bacterium]|nr:hypothetical protein [Bdellovibrionota bacterium]